MGYTTGGIYKRVEKIQLGGYRITHHTDSPHSQYHCDTIPIPRILSTTLSYCLHTALAHVELTDLVPGVGWVTGWGRPWYRHTLGQYRA
eukprot:2974600-Rhodomonas_salina.3